MKEMKQRQIDILRDKYGRQYDSLASMKQFLVEYKSEMPKDLFDYFISDLEELRNGFAYLINESYGEELVPSEDPGEVVNPEIYTQEAIEDIDKCRDGLTKCGLDRVLHSWKPYNSYGKDYKPEEVDSILASNDLSKVQKLLTKVSSSSKVALFDDAITITPILKKVKQKEIELNKNRPASLKLTHS